METKSAKVCTSCLKEKDESEFYVDKRRNAPYGSCKTCWNEHSTKWAEENPEKRKASRDKYAAKQGIERYGITEEEYDCLLDEQQKVCAICKNPETKVVYGKIIRLAIDHDHVTDEVRGLLCSNCNSLLAMASDSVETLQAAITYLQGEK